MSKFRKKKKGMPAVNTASLPDIVFMLLFFFMVTTTMRETDLKLENPSLPSATEVKKLEHKSLVSTIYVGKSKDVARHGAGFNRIQLNDKFANVNEIAAFIAAERASKREELIPFLTTALKVDGDANMGLIGDIKQELRKVNALKLNYTTKKGSVFGRD